MSQSSNHDKDLDSNFQIPRKSFATGNGITRQQVVAYQYQPGRPYAICASRLVAKKGVDVLLQAFSYVADYWPDLDLLIVGDGPQRGSYQQMIEELGLEGRVQLLGAVSHEQTLALVKGAAVQVIPSREEAFGIVVLEALDQGQIVIASRVGGLAEALSDVAGVRLVPPSDPAILACALIEARVGDISLRASKSRKDPNPTNVASRISAPPDALT